MNSVRPPGPVDPMGPGAARLSPVLTGRRGPCGMFLSLVEGLRAGPVARPRIPGSLRTKVTA